MASVNAGPFEVDWEVDYPNITLTAYIDIPDWVPDVGGRNEVGSISLSLDHLHDSINESIGPVSIGFSFDLNLDNCTVSIGASASLDIVIHKWSSSETFSFQYMTPLRFVEPDWSKTVFDPGQLASALQNGDRGVDQPGRPLDESAETQAAIRALFTFAGAGGVIDSWMAQAQGMTAPSAHASPPTAGAPPASEMLFALALTGSGGLGGGLTGAVGLFFTGSRLGRFGSLGLDLGAIASIAMGCMFYCYWPVDGKSALANFLGWNSFIEIGAGELWSGALACFWPSDGSIKPVDPDQTPCGFGVELGLGAGVPFTLVGGNCDTIQRQDYPGTNTPPLGMEHAAEPVAAGGVTR
jgi:hypothetical protein